MRAEDRIFAEVLVNWYRAECQVISEFSGDITRETKEARARAYRWLAEYEEAVGRKVGCDLTENDWVDLVDDDY